MKFWQKLYLSTLILLLVILNLSILTLAKSVYETNLEVEKERGNERAVRMERRISEDFQSLCERDIFNAKTIPSLLSSYSDDYSIPSELFAVLNHEETIYNNFGFDDSSLIPDRELSQDFTMISKVYRTGKVCYYCVYMPLSQNSEYALLYLYKMANLNQLVQELMVRSLITSVIGMTLLAVLLYILVKRMTSPIEKLETTAKNIASGQYDTRVKVRGKDELASVAFSFNEMAEKVQEHIITLEKTNRNRQIFIDNLAHEMNTPLTSIRGYGEYMLHSAVSEEEYFESLDFIVQEAQRLSQMSKQLLLMADVEEGDFDFEDISVKKLKESMEKLFQFRGKEKGIHLSFSSNVEVIKGNYVLLESLLTNLIENSMRACNDTNGQVRVICSQDKKGWRLEVIDNGRGIPKDKLEQVTEPFYRTDKARSRANGGTGLGLALCKQIVLLHHGTLYISSEEGKGTKVTATFTTS